MMAFEDVVRWAERRARETSTAIQDEALSRFLARLLRDPGPAMLSSKARWLRWRHSVADALEARARLPLQFDESLPHLGDEPPPCAMIEAEERAEEVEAAILELTPRERLYVRLHYFEGLPLQEVARRCGVPVGTVKSYGYHARNRMRAALGGDA